MGPSTQSLRAPRWRSRLYDLHGSVIIAVIGVMMMQTAFVQIVQVIPVRRHLVVTTLGAVRSMDVSRMLRAAVIGRASIGVLAAHLDAMGLDDITLLMLEAVAP
jgi:hypothetical protein